MAQVDTCIRRWRGAFGRYWSVDWAGYEQGIEHRLVPAAGLPLHCLTMSGFRGKGVIKKVMSLLRLVFAVLESCALIRRLKPDVVLGMGGYAAAPAGLAAFLSRRPLVIHEQNAVAGTTNRWLSPIAARVLWITRTIRRGSDGRGGGESGARCLPPC